MPNVIERGSGPPIVLVPGIQGRWEWQQPTVEALAAFGRVITFSLCDEPTSGFGWTESAGFENYLSQLDDVIAITGVARPLLIGVSFGGLIAAEFAARYPATLAGLVLASAPPPGWTLPARAQRYLRAPRLMAPVFWLGAPLRMYPELAAAFPERVDLWRFVVSHGRRVATAPASSARMARRLGWLTGGHVFVDRRVAVPVLIVTGDPALERVVPPRDTRRYLTWWPEARVETLVHTGHSGTVTKAGDFARLVERFMMHTAGSYRADRVS